MAPHLVSYRSTFRCHLASYIVTSKLDRAETGQTSVFAIDQRYIALRMCCAVILIIMSAHLWFSKSESGFTIGFYGQALPIVVSERAGNVIHGMANPFSDRQDQRVSLNKRPDVASCGR